MGSHIGGMELQGDRESLVAKYPLVIAKDGICELGVEAGRDGAEVTRR